jgi:uncharacterized protein YqgC (DUF456 family)
VDLSDTDATITLVSGIAIAAGIIGVIIPLLPGLLLCWCGVLFWAIFGDGGWGKWLVFAIATVIAVNGTLIKYMWPGRSLKRNGVPNTSLLVGGVVGLVGFFVIPIVGLVVGFVFGLWLAERARLGDSRLAWPSTKQALKAVGLAVLIELGAALAIAATWGLGLVLA